MGPGVRRSGHLGHPDEPVSTWPAPEITLPQFTERSPLTIPHGFEGYEFKAFDASKGHIDVRDWCRLCGWHWTHELHAPSRRSDGCYVRMPR